MDFDRFTLAERGNRLGFDTRGLKRESDFVFQVVLPAQGLLLRAIRIHDGFVLDAILANRIFFEFLHRFAARMRRTEARPIFNCRAMAALLVPAR